MNKPYLETMLTDYFDARKTSDELQDIIGEMIYEYAAHANYYGYVVGKEDHEEEELWRRSVEAYDHACHIAHIPAFMVKEVYKKEFYAGLEAGKEWKANYEDEDEAE